MDIEINRHGGSFLSCSLLGFINSIILLVFGVLALKYLGEECQSYAIAAIVMGSLAILPLAVAVVVLAFLLVCLVFVCGIEGIAEIIKGFKKDREEDEIFKSQY